MKSALGFGALASLSQLALVHADPDFSQYVNPFHGTEGGGNRFPGVVAAPYAMVKLGPDVSSGKTDAYSGYLPSGSVWGFSMMHESGTGGAPKYGVVSQMPVPGNVSNPLADLSCGRSAADEAHVGYYKSSLSSGVQVELAATEHAGLYQYSFSRSAASVVVDVSHVLPSFRGMGWGQGYVGGNFSVFDNGHYEGSGTYNNGWNLAPDWAIFFCGMFSETPSAWKTFSGNGTKLASYNTQSSVAGSQRLGGVFNFDGANVTSRVGVSFVSAAKACNNVESEIPAASTVDHLRSIAKVKWNESLSRIQISSSDPADLTFLYSNVYGSQLLPSNRTGEDPAAPSEPSYDDYFTFWDTHHCHTPLMHILQPVAYEENLRAMIGIWRRDGYLPDARSSNYNGRSQGGSSADNVLADAFVKGVQSAINWTEAYAAMVTDAETSPPNNRDPAAPDSSDKEGRGALADWLALGYISPAYSRAVSRAVDYSGNDFGLHQVAAGLGLADDAAKYLNRSRNYRNHWNAEAKALNHSGFVVPRAANGSFVAQDPLSCGGCYWDDAYYEDVPWTYSLNAVHDVGTLVQLSGGSARFTDRIDVMFQNDTIEDNEQFGHTIFNPGNEPAFPVPYLYNFVAGGQRKSVERSRQISRWYNGGAHGLPGNSDAGAMEANILWQMIGMYPLTGQTTFLLLSPWFPLMTIDVGGQTLTITTQGGDGDSAFYVQRVRVNGQAWDKGWVTWDDVFAKGGSIDVTLGAHAVDWATGELPPSPACETCW